MNNQLSGREGENIAADYLAGKGYTIIRRNYRTRFGEIDIIARSGRCLCFVEVKTRSQDVYGEPNEAVEKKKQRKMVLAASSYMQNSGMDDIPARFDVVSVHMKDSVPVVSVVQDAFALDENDEVIDV